MAKKDKKAKAAEKKVRVAQKQEKKASQKEKKSAKKKPTDGDDDDDIDLDAVLAEYAKQQEAFLKITEDSSEPPSARGSATLLGSPANDNELFLFGGEYYNGALAKFFNDLFVYKINRDEWLRVTSPNSPLPRSGHAWCRGGNAGGIYMFGGEFSSPKQGTFHHYNDFWHLDPSSREWTKLETKGKGPPARSGHRMTYYKQYVVLFGGFQDTSQQTKYLQDLWLYDCANYTWHNPPLPPASGKPDARSSFSLLPHELGAVLYGGYSRVKAAAKQTKGGNATQTVLKPVVHTDTWFLRITAPPSDAAFSTPPTVRWERRKKPANAPNPARAGATMAAHKGRGVQFGGVHDVEESDEGIDSEFFNALFVWNVERNRYFPLALRRPRTRKVADAPQRMRERGRKDEAELLANLARLEARDASDVQSPAQLQSQPEEEEEDDKRPAKPVLWELPHARFNAMLAVQADVLYVLGGTFEKGDREFTFDDMYAVDLGKLDGCKEIFRRELENWAGSESEDDSEDEEDDDSEDDEAEDEQDAARGVVETIAVAAPVEREEEEEADAPTKVEDDGMPHPRPFESLRDFYARTSQAWQEVVLQKLRTNTSHAAAEEASRSVKEIKKAAFERAEEKWWDCREEIQALEDEQEAAGIGEVVSLADRGGAAAVGSGVGRRR